MTKKIFGKFIVNPEIVLSLSKLLYMKKETVEEGFDRIYDSMDFTEFCFPSFKLGVKWEQEQNGLTMKEGIDFEKELSKWGYNKGNSIDVETLVNEILPDLFNK